MISGKHLSPKFPPEIRVKSRFCQEVIAAKEITPEQLPETRRSKRVEGPWGWAKVVNIPPQKKQLGELEMISTSIFTNSIRNRAQTQVLIPSGLNSIEIVFEDIQQCDFWFPFWSALNFLSPSFHFHFSLSLADKGAIPCSLRCKSNWVPKIFPFIFRTKKHRKSHPNRKTSAIHPGFKQRLAADAATVGCVVDLWWLAAEVWLGWRFLGIPRRNPTFCC